MDELKMMVEMVAKLPQLALWVLIGFWVYKVVVVGSIYGVIRFVVDRLHSWLVTPKHNLLVHDVRLMLDGHCIQGTKEGLVVQLERIKRATGKYVHGSDVEWLRSAIDEKLDREREAAKGRVVSPPPRV